MCFCSYTCTVFVINLERSVERRARILARLQELGLTGEIFTACEGRALPDGGKKYNGRKRRLLFGHEMTAGEIGCAYSHLGVYQEIVRRGLPCALVLEDDALLNETLPDAIKVALAHRAEWDIVRFISSAKVSRLARPIAATLEKGFGFARIYGTPGGAYGYLINEGAAKRLIAMAARIWLPIDTLQGQVWRNGLRAPLMVPSPVLPDFDISSTIGDGRFDKKLDVKGWERIVYPFTRCAYKMWDMASKRISFYGGYLADRRLARRLQARAVDVAPQ